MLEPSVFLSSHSYKQKRDVFCFHSRLLLVLYEALTGSSLVAPPSRAVLLLCSMPLLPLFLRLSPDFNTTEGRCAAVLRTGCQ